MANEQIKQNAEAYAMRVAESHIVGKRPAYVAAFNAFMSGAHSRDKEINELKAKVFELSWLKLSNPWISVEERLPEIGQKVITITNRGKMLLVARTTQPPHREEGGWRWEHYIGKVTHWMPIPQVPKNDN